MGAMPCDRRRCSKVACRFTLENYYLCDDCLQAFRAAIGRQRLTLEEMQSRFRQFVRNDSESPAALSDGRLTVDEYLATGHRWSEDHGWD